MAVGPIRMDGARVAEGSGVGGSLRDGTEYQGEGRHVAMGRAILEQLVAGLAPAEDVEQG